MNEQVRKDTLSALTNLMEILRIKEEKDIVEIKELSNHTIHNASVFQEETSVSIAILIYSLSKIIEREQWKLDYRPILSLLENAKKSLEGNKFDDYLKTIKKLFSLISNLDEKLKLYIGEVISQAQIKKGSVIYRHGISSARAAEILGISQWQLMEYIGKTKLTEGVPEIVDLRTRIKFARGLFA